MTKKIIRNFWEFSAVSVILLGFSLVSFADTLPRYYLQNGTDIDKGGSYDVAPGEVLEVPFKVGNLEEEKKLEIKISVKDMSQPKGSNYLSMPKEWIEVKPDTVILDPQREQTVSIIAKIPENTEKGIYQGMIASEVAEGPDKKETKATIGVSFTTAIGATFLANVDPAFKETVEVNEESSSVESGQQKEQNALWRIMVENYYYIFALAALAILLIAIKLFLRKK